MNEDARRFGRVLITRNTNNESGFEWETKNKIIAAIGNGED